MEWNDLCEDVVRIIAGYLDGAELWEILRAVGSRESLESSESREGSESGESREGRESRESGEGREGEEDGENREGRDEEFIRYLRAASPYRKKLIIRAESKSAVCEAWCIDDKYYASMVFTYGKRHRKARNHVWIVSYGKRHSHHYRAQFTYDGQIMLCGYNVLMPKELITDSLCESAVDGSAAEYSV